MGGGKKINKIKIIIIIIYIYIYIYKTQQYGWLAHKRATSKAWMRALNN